MWATVALLLVVVVGGLEGASITSPQEEEVSQSEVSSPLHVAQCRANCLQKILLLKDGAPATEIRDCSKEPQCHVCWRKCEELEMVAQWRKSIEAETTSKTSSSSYKSSKSVAAICSTSSCSSGCGVACNFYTNGLLSLQSTSSPSPVVATKSRAVLILSPGKVSWSNVVNKEEEKDDQPLVYVLIQQLPHLKWSQVTQTTQNWATMPKTLWDKLEFGVRSVRVLVVSPKGLVAIYHPQQQQQTSSTPQTTASEVSTTISSTTTSTTTITATRDDEMERTWSQMMKVDENYPPMTHDNVGNTKKMSQDDITVTKHVVDDELNVEEEEIVQDIWRLRRLSLIHQKSLVIAELAWDEGVKTSPEQEYLITWELDGGGLKGHLVTDSTTVSLSLWPDTLYHIQVELFEPNFEEGEHEDEESTDSSTTSSSISKSLPLVVDTSEAISFPLLVEKPSALSSQRLLTTSTLVGIVVGFALVLSALLLAISLRRLCSFNRHHVHHGSFSLDKHKQLLQDTDDLVSVETSEKKCMSSRSSSRNNSSRGPQPQARGISVISLSGDLLKGPFSSSSSSCLPSLHQQKYQKMFVGVVGGPFPLPTGLHQQQGGYFRPSSLSSITHPQTQGHPAQIQTKST